MSGAPAPGPAPGAAARGEPAGGARGLRLPAVGSAVAAVALVALALLFTSTAYGLLEPTETRYAEIAREMLASGDWLTPRLNGISHFHKPPLAYWASAAGMAVLGVNEAGARAPAALAAALALALAVLAVRRRFAALGPRPGLVAWVLGTCVLFAALGRSLAADPFLAAAVAGFWAFAGGWGGPVAIGLGFLAKGPVVLVPTVLAVLVAAALGRDREALRLIGPGRAWWPAAFIGLGWYLVLALRVPGLAGYLLGDQIVARYASTEHHRGGPPWYFVAVLLAGLVPWTPALIAGLARAWRERARRESRLALAWLFTPLVFLSFSGSKLPAYLLPAFPAAALLAALGLDGAGRVVRGSIAALLLALAAAGWLAGPLALGPLGGAAAQGRVALPMAAHVALLFFVYAATWAWRRRPERAAVLVLFGTLGLIAAVARYDARLGSPRGLARVLAESRAADEPVVEFARFAAGYPFYLGHTVRLLEVPRESEFDPPAVVARIEVTRDSLLAWTDAGQRVWLVGPEGPSRELAAALDLGYTRLAAGRDASVAFLSR